MSSISEIMLVVMLVISLVALLISVFVGKGQLGEWAVQFRLKRLPSDYIVLKNILLPNGKDSTSQIDHIVVSRFSVFVIETKNYKGWVSGGENSQNWTQNIYGHKYKLYNPILQNEKHIQVLRSLFSGNVQIPFVSIIAFPNRTRVRVDAEEAHVVSFSEINSTIKSYHIPLLDSEQVAQIAEIIRKENREGELWASIHTKNAQHAKELTQQKVENGICPRCGGKLVLRNGRYGSFIGCSNYPQCTYTDSCK